MLIIITFILLLKQIGFLLDYKSNKCTREILKNTGKKKREKEITQSCLLEEVIDLAFLFRLLSEHLKI